MLRTWSPRIVIVLLLSAALAAMWAYGDDRMLLSDMEYFGSFGFGFGLKHAAYWLGLGALQAAFAGVLILAGMLWEHLRITATGWAALIAVAASGLLVQVFKHIVGRPRPGQNMDAWQLQGFTFESDMHSFPSGHAATSFALAAVLAARFPRLAWLFYAMAALIGLGRVMGGSHFASDVIAGCILGLLCGWLIAWRFKLREDIR